MDFLALLADWQPQTACCHSSNPFSKQGVLAIRFQEPLDYNPATIPHVARALMTVVQYPNFV